MSEKTRLLLIGGPPGVGKTAVARELFSGFSGSAWLDGDDVWRMNPFESNERTQPIVEANIPFVLSSYLAASFASVTRADIERES